MCHIHNTITLTQLPYQLHTRAYKEHCKPLHDFLQLPFHVSTTACIFTNWKCLITSLTYTSAFKQSPIPFVGSIHLEKEFSRSTEKAL
eukprot:c30575_g1_i1 orf=155-418(+)